MRSILRTTRDGFTVTDMDGNFLDVNDAACDMFGYSRQQFLRLSMSGVTASGVPVQAAERIRRIKSDGHMLYTCKSQRKDGTTFDVEVSASFLGGEEDRIIAFYRPIPERFDS